MPLLVPRNDAWSAFGCSERRVAGFALSSVIAKISIVVLENLH
jgi:hypothetical protein